MEIDKSTKGAKGNWRQMGLQNNLIMLGDQLLIVCLYVDDLIFTGNSSNMFDDFKQSMMAEFDMTDLGTMHYFLGIEVAQTSDRIFISQKKYIQEILNKFQMANCNSAATPFEVRLKLIKKSGWKEG